MASSPPPSSSLPPRLPPTDFPVRAPSFIELQHSRSDLVTFSSTPSTTDENVDTIDADEQEARDEPAPKLHCVDSVHRISLTATQKPLERRYSVDEQATRSHGNRSPKRHERQYQHQPIESGQSSEDIGSKQSGSTQQGGDGEPKGIMERLQNTVALKRLSRSSLLPSPTSPFFAAVMAATANATAKEDAAGQQYEEMMERFQIRRLQHTASSGSNGTGKNDIHTHVLSATRSGKVIPASNIDGVPAPVQVGHSNSPTPRSHSSHSKGAAPANTTKEPSRQTSSRSESAAQPSHVPVLVIKPRSSTQKLHEEATKTARSGASSSSSGRFSLHWKLMSWRRKLRRRGRNFAKRIATPLSPFSIAARVRGLALLLAFLAHAIYFPVGVAFSSSTGRHWFHYVDLGTEFVFMLDFVLSFNTSFQDKRGVLVTSRREIARNYIRGWCIPELLAAIPVESILFFRGEQDDKWMHVFMDGVFRTQRLVHVVRILRLIWMMHAGSSGKSIWAWLIYSRYSHLVRIFWIILLIVLLAHYMACCWKLLEDSSSINSDITTQQSLTEQYASNFYDALQLLQGQGLTTSTIGQSVFASSAVLLGSIVFAIVFGNVAMLVSNFNANSTNYQRKMESVFAIMSKLQLPALLRERIHQYYEHLWREYESLDSEIVKFSKDLTHNLALEVVLFKYMDLVLNIPFWRDCTPDFQKQIALSLQVRVYLPDDFILRRGEVGDEFYMINRGSCELSTDADSFEQATAPLSLRTHNEGGQSSGVSKYANSAYYGQTQNEKLHKDGEAEFDKRSQLKTERASGHGNEARKMTSKHTRLLTRGQAFGEAALLMNYQRTANVRAVTYVEMCVLSRADFQTILTRYPDDRKHVLSMILITCMESNETRQVYCPLKAIVELVFADGDARIADQISARYAANIISTVVNPDYEDDSMKFGIGQNFKKELKKLKDQDEAQGLGDIGSETAAASQLGSQPSGHLSRVERIQVAEKAETSVNIHDETVNESPLDSSPTVPSELENRISKIEDTQMQTLLLLQEMRAAMDELRQIPTPVVYVSSAGSDDKAPLRQQQPLATALSSEQTASLTLAAVTPFTTYTSGDDSTTQQGSKHVQEPTRNVPFLRKRSATAPDLLLLSETLAHEMSMERAKDTSVPDSPDTSPMAASPIAPPTNKRLRTEPPNTPNEGTGNGQVAQLFSRRRGVSLRDLTEKQKTELSSVKPVSKPPLLAEQRGLAFRLRRKMSQPDVQPPKPKAKRNGSSLTKRLLMQHIGSLVSFMSTPTQAGAQQSPTCYADQLFHTREPSGGNANVAVRESISSEATQE